MHKSPQEYLLQCIAMASSKIGLCAPNPPVAALVVKDDVVLGLGVHQGAGTLHAEPIALQDAGAAARGAAIYVSLEPCAHYGRTPPCVEAILQAGIKEVYYAHHDVDKRVRGAGREFLLANGIKCELVRMAEADELYRYYDYWQRHKLPWIAAKLAVSADYKVAAADKSPLQISGVEANLYTQQQRLQHDAILSTVATVNNDNPSFNVRLESGCVAKPVFILDSKLQIRHNAKLWQTAKDITLFYAAGVDEGHLSEFVAKGANCVPVQLDAAGELSLTAVLQYIGSQGMHALWVEVGPRCLRSFYQQGLLQRMIVYKSEQALGQSYSGCDWLAAVLADDRFDKGRLGADFLFDGLFDEE